MAQKTQTAKWTGGLGFVMACAGASVGMGNLWRFPMLVGQNGGGAFVLVYLLCILLIGIPMLLAEIAIGRHGGGDAFVSFRAIHPKWGGAGVFAVVISLIGLSYYTVLGGWVLRYLAASLTGGIENSATFFAAFTASPWQQVLFYSLYMTLTILIVVCGVTKGIEKACKVMLPALFICLAVLAVRACTLPGAGEGIRFYLEPDFSKLTPGTWLSALGQVFFSLSIGAGAGVTYGAYLPKQAHIVKSACWIAGFDTLAALLAGFAILPAVFSTGHTPQMGPGLLFVILPEVFDGLPGGAFFFLVFFLLVLFASLTTTIAFLEVVVSFVCGSLRLKRPAATVGSGLTATLLGIPCALSFGVLRGATVFGKTLFDLADGFVSNLALPISAILTCLLIGWVWKPRGAIRELTNNGALRFCPAKVWGVWIQAVLPAGIFLILLSSLGVFS